MLGNQWVSAYKKGSQDPVLRAKTDYVAAHVLNIVGFQWAETCYQDFIYRRVLHRLDKQQS